MIKAVFLDLDDTLLRIDTNAFIPQYLRGVVKLILQQFPHVANAAVPIDKAMQRAISAIMENLDPSRSNLEIFMDTLCGACDLPVEPLGEVFNAYHVDGYQALQSLSTPVERTTHLIERLSDMGIAVVIATAPVFGLDAIKSRIKWAGLDSPRVPYAFISNIEETHFSKPQPHYYEELLARVGIEADEAIMIGDDVHMDMLPAARAGLNTYWLHLDRDLPSDFPSDLQPDGIGTIADFESQVASGWLSTLKPRPLTAEQVVPRMLGNTGALFGLVDTIKPEYWNMRPDPEEWSPLEIICHMRDSERNVQRPRLQRIAAESNPFISQPPPPPRPREQDLSAENGITVLREFWDERCNTITYLNQLTAEDWQRKARHSIFGPTTLMEMAHFTARHDHLHINQLCQTVGRCKQNN